MNTQTSAWIKVRKFFNDIHLWLGLSSGLVIFFVCLSGTLYIYNNEFVRMSERNLHNVKPLGLRKPIDLLLANMEVPEETHLTAVEIPTAKDQSYAVQFSAIDGDRKKNQKVYINPYSGQILGHSDPNNRVKKWMGYLFSMHRWLLLDKIESPLIGNFSNRKLGSIITGVCTIIFTLGVITGIIIWFPNRLRSWKQGLKVKTGGSWKRTNHDLHNTLGFYAFIFLLLMGITGPFFSFEWYRNGLRKTLGTYKAPQKEKSDTQKQPSNVKEQGIDKSIDFPVDALARVLIRSEQFLPYNGDYRVVLQEKKWVVYKNKIGFFAPSASDKIEFDASTKQVLKVERFADKPFNEKISSSIKAIHMGSVFGGFSKLLYLLSCLIATSLPVTGTLIWLNKMKKKK